MKNTHQIQQWEGSFGREYTSRNPYLFDDTEALYSKLYGVRRTEMNSEFIGQMDRSLKILEVGSNVGAQLIVLQNMGFSNLYGIELQEGAIEFSKTITRGIYIIKGSALDIPFKDHFFDMVFTSGVLIHISPQDIAKAIQEIYRTSKKYIWGFEYFAEKFTEIEYRGEKNLLWKANYPDIYMKYFSDLHLVKERKFKYLQNDNRDQMYLLEKYS